MEAILPRQFYMIPSKFKIVSFQTAIISFRSVHGLGILIAHIRVTRTQVPDRLGDLSWDLVGSARVLNRFLALTKESPNNRQWQRNTKPHDYQCEEGAERNSIRRVLVPHKQVEQEHNEHQQSRNQSGGQNRILEPRSAFEHLVEASRVVSSKCTISVVKIYVRNLIKFLVSFGIMN